jgi:regulator of replication initiation timing
MLEKNNLLDETKMERLKRLFREGELNNIPFISIEVRMTGFPKNEIIANPTENFPRKMAYLEKVYDKNLVNIFSPGIEIVAAHYGDDNEQKEWDLTPQ